MKETTSAEKSRCMVPHQQRKADVWDDVASLGRSQRSLLVKLVQEHKLIILEVVFT
jgi:hypothetical protein